MTRSADELLVAAAVLPLAKELQTAARKEAEANADLHWRESPALSSAPTQEEREAFDRASAAADARVAGRQAFSKRWLSEHPVEEFACEALAQLEKIAQAISGPRS